MTVVTKKQSLEPIVDEKGRTEGTRVNFKTSRHSEGR